MAIVTRRYRAFRCFAARLDDVSNYISCPFDSFSHDTCFSSPRPVWGSVEIRRNILADQHAGPNSSYPEAALAGILDCRFGGPHNYFGEEVWKPYIGSNDRLLTTEDMKVAVRINRRAEGIMIVILIITTTLISFFI
ncbi:MAG: cobalamin biosynthesis protein [Bacteroides cellulosilyticus]